MWEMTINLRASIWACSLKSLDCAKAGRPATGLALRAKSLHSAGDADLFLADERILAIRAGSIEKIDHQVSVKIEHPT